MSNKGGKEEKEDFWTKPPSQWPEEISLSDAIPQLLPKDQEFYEKWSKWLAERDIGNIRHIRTLAAENTEWEKLSALKPTLFIGLKQLLQAPAPPVAQESRPKVHVKQSNGTWAFMPVARFKDTLEKQSFLWIRSSQGVVVQLESINDEELSNLYVIVTEDQNPPNQLDFPSLVAPENTDVLKINELLQVVHRLNLTLAISQCQSLSHVAAFNVIHEHFGWSEQTIIPTDGIGDELLKDMWDTFSYESPTDQLESAYQELVNRLLKHMKTKLGDLVKFHIHPKAIISNPLMCPDFTATLGGLLSWKNAVFFGEVETQGKRKEGVGQVASYLSRAVIAADRQYGTSFYTDCFSVEFISLSAPLDSDKPTWSTSGRLELLPPIKPKFPTPGFSLLANLLIAPLSQLGFKKPAKEAFDCGNETVPLQFLAHGNGSTVYVASIGGNSWAVKINDSTFPSQVRREFQFLKAVCDVGGSNDCFPQLHPSSTDSCLISKPVGVVLENALVGVSQKIAAGYLKDLVKTLQAAHKLGYAHHDIRPSNIILENDHARLIDWGCACQVQKESEDTVIGSIRWLSTRILKEVQKSQKRRGYNWVYCCRDDLESLVYVFMFMMENGIRWRRAETINAIVQMREQMLQGNTSQAALFQLVQCFKETPTTQEYAQLLQFIEDLD